MVSDGQRSAAVVDPGLMGDLKSRTYRFPVTLVERIDTYKARVAAKLPPGAVVNETQLVIELITRGLDTLEADAAKDAKKGGKR